MHQVREQKIANHPSMQMIDGNNLLDE